MFEVKPEAAPSLRSVTRVLASGSRAVGSACPGNGTHPAALVSGQTQATNILVRLTFACSTYRKVTVAATAEGHEPRRQ